MKKILFLAQFAPVDGDIYGMNTDEDKFYYETYHKKIYEILETENIELYSHNDVQFLIDNHKDIDLVWSLYNRLPFRNSEIFVQSLCEYLNINYIGATPNIRALVEDKSMSKQLAEHLNINTPDWVVGSKDYPLCSIEPFPGPYFIKPRFGSASIGINESSLCSTWGDVKKKASEFFEDNIDVIVEKFIDGLYYGVPVLNTINKDFMIATPHIQESTKRGNIITNKQKRKTESGMIRNFCEEDNLNTQLKHITSLYFKEMQPCDYARIDFIVEKNTGIPYFLEVNVLMNLGIQGGFVSSFLKDDFKTYEDIIKHILKLGYEKLKK